MTFIVTNAAFKATLNERWSARRLLQCAYNKNEKYFGMHIALRCKKYQVSVKIKFFSDTIFHRFTKALLLLLFLALFCHTCVLCSFTIYFKTFWYFASQVTSFMFIWKCIGQKIMNWNGDFYMRGTLVTFRIIWSTSKREMQKVTFLLMTIGLLFYYPDYHQNPWSFLRLLLSIKKP